MAENCFTLLWVSLFLYIYIVATEDLARGWGDDIQWFSLEAGKEKAREENKPLMIVIHKTWCGACKALKPKFAEHEKIRELSKSFVMVNTQDDEEPKEKQFSPDGSYIPRILFLDFSGKVREEFYNEGGHTTYKYYYPLADQIAVTMQKVQGELIKETTESKNEL